MAPKASAKTEPDESLSMLASINELLKMQLKLSGFALEVDTGLIL